MGKTVESKKEEYMKTIVEEVKKEQKNRLKRMLVSLLCICLGVIVFSLNHFFYNNERTLQIIGLIIILTSNMGFLLNFMSTKRY